MSMVESIRIACVKRGNISEAELARRVGVSPQNFHNKMKRDNFTETDLHEIAEALGLKLDISFIQFFSNQTNSLIWSIYIRNINCLQ